MKIELNSAGVRELLRSPEMESGLAELAAEIAAKAGSGYESDTKMMGTRVIASASAATEAAMKDNLANNTLLRALGGSG